MSDPIEVSVWEDLGGGNWAVVRDLTYSRLEFTAQHLDLGAWSITLPLGSQAAELQPGRLVTTSFRGDLRTWTIEPITIGQGSGEAREVTVGGFDAVSILGWSLAWPDPLAGLGAQPAQGNYSGPAETVIRTIVGDNLGQRYGMPFDLPDSFDFGGTVRSRPRFKNLYEETMRLARRGGGFSVHFGLTRTQTNNDTRARLALWFYETLDRSRRVEFTAADGSISEWELVRNSPKVTKAIVGGAGDGAGQYLRERTNSQGDADAAEWGGHRETYVDGADTTDNVTLDDAGDDAIAEGAATSTLTMTAEEPRGTKAFRDFMPGDTAAWIPYPGVTITDTISAVRVTHEDVGDPVVEPMTGDPDQADPESQNAKLIRRLYRRLNALETNRKRGSV